MSVSRWRRAIVLGGLVVAVAEAPAREVSVSARIKIKGDPVRGVKVRVTDPNGPGLTTLETGEEGLAYGKLEVAGDSVDLLVDHPQFEVARKTLPVHDGKARGEMELQPTLRLDGVVFGAQPAGMILEVNVENRGDQSLDVEGVSIRVNLLPVPSCGAPTPVMKLNLKNRIKVASATSTPDGGVSLEATVEGSSTDGPDSDQRLFDMRLLYSRCGGSGGTAIFDLVALFDVDGHSKRHLKIYLPVSFTVVGLNAPASQSLWIKPCPAGAHGCTPLRIGLISGGRTASISDAIQAQASVQ